MAEDKEAGPHLQFTTASLPTKPGGEDEVGRGTYPLL